MFLVNAFGESNLALSVRGNYYIGFQSDKYVLVTVEMEEDTQYVKHFAKDMIKNFLYPHTPAGHEKSIGQRVQYMPINQEANLFSHQIAAAKLLGGLKSMSHPFGIDQYALQDEMGRITILSVGSGFQTAQGLGVVMEIHTSGSIVKWRELWDQDYFSRTYPCILQAMRGFYVLETDLQRSDPQAVLPQNIIRVFPIKPLALAQQRDMPGEGAKFIVGTVTASKGEPIQIYGLKALSGEKLLDSLYEEAAICHKIQLGSYSDPLRAAIEDGLQYIADYKPESSRKPPSPIELHMIPGEICMALLHQFTSHADRKEVIYDENHMSVEYFDDWRGLEPIMKRKLKLKLRNAMRTEVPHSGVVVAWAAKFKWMLLPYSKLVVSLRYYKLLTPGETGSHLDTSGTKSREYSAKITDKNVCRQCLRCRFGAGCECYAEESE